MKNFFRKIAKAINRFFALQVINLFKKLYTKYPEGVVATGACFREIYKQYPEYRHAITFMYKDIAQKELKIDVSLMPIKKGNTHYHIIVCKDRQLKTVFFLERHADDGTVTNIKPSYSEIVKK